MKNVQINACFFALFIIMAFGYSSCISTSQEKPLNPSSDSVKLDDTISLERACIDIRNYSTWWGITPDSMSFNAKDSTIRFKEKKVSDSMIIEAFMAYQKKFPNKMAPFYDEQGPAMAHVIRSRELMKALGIKDHLPKYDGIRVYLGTHFPDSIDFKKDPEEFLKHTKTRLYFVPVKKESGPVEFMDKIPGEGDDRFVYDLTMPCPRSCDTESELYQAIKRN